MGWPWNATIYTIYILIETIGIRSTLIGNNGIRGDIQMINPECRLEYHCYLLSRKPGLSI